MNRLLRGSGLFLALAALSLFTASPASAADLTYTTPLQTGDSELIVAHKQAAAAVNGNSYTNISTAATTVIKTGSGVLERIQVNTAGAGSTFVVYDNTAGSGTKIASGTAAAISGYHYNVRFTTGLTIVTASGTPADLTVSWR